MMELRRIQSQLITNTSRLFMVDVTINDECCSLSSTLPMYKNPFSEKHNEWDEVNINQLNQLKESVGNDTTESEEELFFRNFRIRQNSPSYQFFSNEYVQVNDVIAVHSLLHRDKCIDADGKIKRPLNSFMVWAKIIRKIINDIDWKESSNTKLQISPNQKVSKIDERRILRLSKILGGVWKTLKEEDKRPFIEAAEVLKEQHRHHFPSYRYRPNKRSKLTPVSDEQQIEVVKYPMRISRIKLSDLSTVKEFHIHPNMIPPIIESDLMMTETDEGYTSFNSFTET
ncbi:hypothetical protein SNEBB_005688 [Seison nebaliae]|nr:hypothetical protein SNEBB_005688 [Seison nebaliae]